MSNKNYYDPSQGLMVISRTGSQKITEGLDAASGMLPQYFTDIDIGKFTMDSAWETGDIYYANWVDKCVVKIRYTGEEIARLSLEGPTAVVVIQNQNKMSQAIGSPIPQDRGCWIVDYGSNRIIRADASLNIIASIKNTFQIIGVAQDIADGCYAVSRLNNCVFHLDGNAVVDGILQITDIDPAWTTFRDIVADATGRVYLATDKKVYCYIFDGGVFIKLREFSPTSFADDHIGCIDVDRNADQMLYIAGADRSQSWIRKYNASGILVNYRTYIDTAFPNIIKVSQSYGSDAIYVISDPSKWEQYAYGSSSSSESSSSSYDSSSSSSSTSSFDSSSSSTEHWPVRAHDDANQSAYPGYCSSGWCENDNGGYGWGGGWVLTKAGTSGMSGHWLDTIERGGLICTNQKSWGLWAYDGEIAEAIRYFHTALSAGHTFSTKFKHVFTDDYVGFELHNSSNEALFGFYFKSTASHYVVYDSNGQVETSIPLTHNGLEIIFKLHTAYKYHISVRDLGTSDTYYYAGYLASGVETIDIVLVKLINHGSGNDPSDDVFFNDINIITDIESSSSSSMSSESIGNTSSSSSSPALYSSSSESSSSGLVSIVPLMTNDYTPAPYVVSASQNSVTAYYAFDDSLATAWLSSFSTLYGHITVDLGSGNEKIVQHYSITAYGGGYPSAPKDWTLQASNTNFVDPSDIYILDTQTSQTVWGTPSTRYYKYIGNHTAYRYYRLNVTDNNGYYVLAIYEFKIYE